MRRQMRTLLFVALLLGAFTLGAYASTGKGTSISAVLRQDSMYIVDNKEMMYQDANGTMQYPIEYNGALYIPASVVQSITENSILWDQPSGKVVIVLAKQAAGTTGNTDAGTGSTNGTAGGTAATAPQANEEGLVIGDEIKHVAGNGSTQSEGKITNASGQNYPAVYIAVTYLDSNGKVLGTGRATLQNMANGTTSDFKTTAGADFSNAVSFQIKASASPIAG